jgi:hypothetical protein
VLVCAAAAFLTDTGLAVRAERSLARADLLQAVLGRFTMVLPGIALPWGVPASAVTSAGSDILIEGRSDHRDLSLNNF